MLVHMHRPNAEDLDGAVGTSSREVRTAVLESRERQARRLAGTGFSTNAELTPRLAREVLRADAAAVARLRRSYAEGTLSARGHGRVQQAQRVALVVAADGVDRGRLEALPGVRGFEALVRVPDLPASVSCEGRDQLVVGEREQLTQSAPLVPRALDVRREARDELSLIHI